MDLNMNTKELEMYVANKIIKLVTEDDASKEGTAPMTDKIKTYVINFINDKNGAKINDDEIHSIADKFKVNVHELEGFIYSTLSKDMAENKKVNINQLIENKIKYIKHKNQIIENVKRATAIVRLKLIKEGDDDMSDYAYKAYRYITDAMFITLKHPALKKEFYRALTDMQNKIEKFLFDYNKASETV